jgi:hypothetical protein
LPVFGNERAGSVPENLYGFPWAMAIIVASTAITTYVLIRKRLF